MAEVLIQKMMGDYDEEIHPKYYIMAAGYDKSELYASVYKTFVSVKFDVYRKNEKTCRKKLRVKINIWEGMLNLIFGNFTVGGNYNSTCDNSLND